MAASGSNLVETMTVLVVEHDPTMRDHLSSVVESRGSVVTCRAIDDVGRVIGDRQGAIVILGPSCGSRESLAQVDLLSRGRPDLAAVLVVENVTTDLLREALRAGVRDVVALDHTLGDQLDFAFDAIRERLGIIRGAGAPTTPERRGRCIVVVSAKGGVGKSVVSANLACALRAGSTQDVAVVDADLQFGDIAVMMRLAPKYTMVDAVEAGARIDAQMLRSLLTRHDGSGALVLAAPSDPRHADQIQTADVVRICTMLTETFDYVVVDTPPQLNDLSLSLMEVADDVVLVTSADIANVKNMKIALEVLNLIGIDEHKAHLVMNRAGSKAKLDLPAVERTLRTKVACYLPSSVVVPESVNRGVPVVLHSPKSAVAKSFEDLAKTLIRARV
jgi:pilus assembly protein CpaE